MCRESHCFRHIAVLVILSLNNFRFDFYHNSLINQLLKCAVQTRKSCFLFCQKTDLRIKPKKLKIFKYLDIQIHIANKSFAPILWQNSQSTLFYWKKPLEELIIFLKQCLFWQLYLKNKGRFFHFTFQTVFFCSKINVSPPARRTFAPSAEMLLQDTSLSQAAFSLGSINVWQFFMGRNLESWTNLWHIKWQIELLLLSDNYYICFYAN